MHSAPQDKTGPFSSLRGNLNLALFICRAWATSLEVFLHRDIGDRYLSWNSAAVLLLVPLYLLGWQGYDPRPLGWFLIAYLGMCGVARLNAAGRRARGEAGHSLYTGWPRFLGPKARWSEVFMKRMVEPVVTFLFGCMVRDWWNAPLGTYLMIGAVCLLLSASASDALERVRSMDLNDAIIEQQWTADRLRTYRSDR